MRYAEQKRRATTSKQYAMDMDYDKVLKDAKRIHRDDEAFYIIISSGCYSSLGLWEYEHYNYQPSDILQHWKFEGKRWRLVEDKLKGMDDSEL